MRIPQIPGYSGLEQIASGASSVVYLGQTMGHRRKVAIKVLNAPTSSDRDRRAFERELAAMSELADHPHIVDLIASGFTAEGHPYIVMPFYRNGTYGRLVEQHGPMAWHEVADFGVKIASALETAHHRGYVHRDIKPANIYRSEFSGHPLLADFGVSSFVTPGMEGPTTVTVAATPLFCAPEVLNGVRPTTLSDIYSLGTTLFGLIEGRAAYSSGSVDSVIGRVTAPGPVPVIETGGVPDDLRRLVAKMMSKNPIARPPSALSVAQALNTIQRDHSLSPTALIVPDGTDVTVPDGTDVTVPDGTDVTVPDGTDVTVPDGTDVTVPDGAGVSEPDGAGVPAPGGTGINEAETSDTAIRPADSEPGPSGPGPEAGVHRRLRAGGSTGLGDTGLGDTGLGVPDRISLSGQETQTVEALDRPTEPVGAALKPKSPRTSPVLGRPGWGVAIAVAALALIGLVAYSQLSGTDPLAPESPPPLELVREDDRRWQEPALRTASWSAHDGVVGGLAWSPDGRHIATGGRDEAVRIWPVGDTEAPATTVQLPAWALDLDWSDTDGLVAADSAGHISSWMADGEARPNTVTVNGSPVEAVAWEAGGDRLVSGGGDGVVRIWSMGESGPVETHSMDGHPSGVLTVDWSTENPWLATGGQDGKIRIWETDDGDERLVIDAHDDWVRSVEWSPRSRALASAGADRTVRVWDGQTGDELRRLPTGADPTGRVVWSPSGAILAVGGEDGSVQLWNVSGDLELGVVEADGAIAVTALGWSPDGASLAIGRADGTVELWSPGEATGS